MTGSKKLLLVALTAAMVAVSGCAYRPATFPASSNPGSAAARQPAMMSEIVVTAEPLVSEPGLAVAQQSPANPASPISGLTPVYE